MGPTGRAGSYWWLPEEAGREGGRGSWRWGRTRPRKGIRPGKGGGAAREERGPVWASVEKMRCTEEQRWVKASAAGQEGGEHRALTC